MLPHSRAPINKSLLLPIVSTASTTIAKSFSDAAKQQMPPLLKSALSRRLPRTSSPVNNHCWLPTMMIHAATNGARYRQSSIASQFRSQSSFRNTKHGHTTTTRGSSSNNNNNNTLSTLSNIFAAGIGTFASTLAALYLATIVETSAHEFLYEYFPHWYGEVPTESLPHCLLSRELARRVTGVVVMHRSRGVGTEDGEESMMLMGMDGWVEQGCERHRRQQRQEDVRKVPSPTLPSPAWENTAMENRARIIEHEENEFSRGFDSSTTTATSTSSSSSSGNKMMMMGDRFMEKVQAEATRKFQDKLASIAMTA